MPRMRVVPSYEKKQRGCEACLHVGKVRDCSVWRIACPFAECPYHVLDKYKTYEEFMASEDSKILVNEFFSSAASCYELASINCSPKRVYSYGDGGCSL